MKRLTWSLRWSAAALLGLAIACGCWVLAGACTTAGVGGEGANDNGDAGPDGTEAIDITEATCESLDDQADGFEVRVSAVSSQGHQLACTNRSITDRENGSSQKETEVTADGELVMLITSSSSPVGTNGSVGVQVQIEYGPLVPGVSSASAVVEEGIVSGMVDGRAFVPMPVDDEFDASAASFQDGAPPPELGMDPDLEAAVTDLLAAAATTAEGCSAPNGNESENAEKVVGTALKNTGHYSETVETQDCAECWGKCIAEGVACALACSFTGPGYAFCLGACIYHEVTCDDDCYDGGGGCCPVACYSAFLVDVCCLEGEKCLNDELGTCCGPGEKPCEQKYCCEGTEECVKYDLGVAGPNCCEPQDICGDSSQRCCNPTDDCIPEYAWCCPADQPFCLVDLQPGCCDSDQECINNNSVCCDVLNICGDRCCTDEETCHAGVCCPQDKVCGTVCCDVLDSACIPELSLCCGFDQDVCGSACCPIGESCVGGTACCPDARICGDVCCPEAHGCDSQTNQCTACPNPTDSPCLVGGCCPAGTLCQDVEGFCCNPGETCCDAINCSGGCQPIGECIS
jgi:hypothetical protein